MLQPPRSHYTSLSACIDFRVSKTTQKNDPYTEHRRYGILKNCALDLLKPVHLIMLPEAPTLRIDLYFLYAIHIKRLTRVQNQIFHLICQKYPTQHRAFMHLFI